MSEPRRQELADLRAFIGPNSDYYLGELAKSERPGERVSFNFAAFFLSVGWMLYRRMYRRAVIFFVTWECIEMALYFLFRVTGVGADTFSADRLWTWTDRITGLAASGVCGALGNRWYLQHVAEKISALPHSDERTAEHAQAVGKAGQVSITHAILGTIVIGGGAYFLESLLNIPH